LNRSDKYINLRAIGLTFSETNISFKKERAAKVILFFTVKKKKIGTSG
jgi:hypothetical protein